MFQIMRRKLIIVSAILLTVFAFGYTFFKTDLYIPKQKEIKNPEIISDKLIHEFAKNVASKNDTIYLALTTMAGVCGNDPRFDGIATLEEKLQEMEYLRKNPYFFDTRYFKNGYRILIEQ